MVTLYKLLAIAFGALTVIGFVIGKDNTTINLTLLLANSYMILAKVYE